MARRQGRGITRLLLALALVAAACASTGGPAVTTTSLATSTTPVQTTTSTSATTTSTTTPVPATTTTTLGELADIGVEVLVPEGEGPFPAVVLVHGGGWMVGSPALMRPLARHLTDAGYLTINTPYQLSTTEVAGFPAAVDDVACAVRYAASHPDSDGTVTVIGHSAGAHLAASGALTGDDYGSECPWPGSGLADRLVGLGGPYDVRRLGLAMLPFFGAGPAAAPETWLAGNPQLLTDENPDLVALIMHGDEDGLVDIQFATDFDAALTASGSQSLVEIVEGANHGDLSDPNVVGDLIIVWLDR